MFSLAISSISSRSRVSSSEIARAISGSASAKVRVKKPSATLSRSAAAPFAMPILRASRPPVALHALSHRRRGLSRPGRGGRLPRRPAHPTLGAEPTGSPTAMLDAIRRLFGGKGGGQETAETAAVGPAVEYKGFSIQPLAMRQASGFLTPRLISPAGGGQGG